MNYRERITQINERLAALDTELDSASAERIEAIETEARALKAEREEATRKMAAEARAAFGAGTSVAQPAPTAEVDQTIARMSAREKRYLILGRQVRGKSFTDIEKRALGSALTTTAATFVEATADVNGVNNAGIFIPTNQLLDFLIEDKKLSPIFADVAMTSISGLVDFPYRKNRDKAKAKAEGVDGKENQMEWDKLTGTKGYLQTIIAITDEVRSLSDMDLGAYIMGQMLEDLNEDWGSELIYGTAADDRVKGLTYQATAAVTGGYPAGGVVAAIVAGVKLCKGKFRRGAKIYMAQDVADEIMFDVDDNGNFKYPIFNNSAGIASFGTIRTDVDENLNAGEFIIGNVAKFYKVNALIPVRMETNRLARKGVTEYIASAYCSTSVYPGAFIRGTKQA